MFSVLSPFYIQTLLYDVLEGTLFFRNVAIIIQIQELLFIWATIDMKIIC